MEVILLKTPYTIAFTGNTMPFVFAVSPYRGTEKAQNIVLQVRVYVEDVFGTDIYTEIYSQNIFPDNNGMVNIDVHTLLNPYLQWFTPKSSLPVGIINEATTQRKRYKLSYLLQQNGNLVGTTVETPSFIAIKGGLGYENEKPVDFFTLTKAGTPLHYPVTKNLILPDQPLFFWWLMPEVPDNMNCIPVSYTPVTLREAFVGEEYDDYIYLSGTQPYTISNFSGPAGMSYSFDGKDVHLEGTPTIAGNNQTVSFTMINCAGAPVVFSQQINVTDNNVPTCVDVIIGAFNLPAATTGQFLQFSIPFSGSTPVDETIIERPIWLGNPNIGYNQQGTGGFVNFSGTPGAGDAGNYRVAFTLNNCATGAATFDETGTVAQGVSAPNTTITASTSPRSGTITGTPGQTYTVYMSAGGSGTFNYHLSVDAGGSGNVSNTQTSTSFTFVMPGSGQTGWDASYSSSDSSSSGSFSVS